MFPAPESDFSQGFVGSRTTSTCARVLPISLVLTHVRWGENAQNFVFATGVVDFSREFDSRRGW
jgi:hypothetical protein